MAANLFRLYQSGGNVANPRVATAPGGDVYVADTGTGSATVARIARIANDGTIAWQRELSFGSNVLGASAHLVSSSTRVALVVLAVDGSDDSRTHISVYDTSGVRQWQAAVILHVAGACITPDNSVYVYGVPVNGGSNETVVQKYSSTGTVAWQATVNASTFPYSQSVITTMVPLSTNDVVCRITGFNGTGLQGYLQRLSAADGSVVWTRGLTWASGQNTVALAVDGSDNIYVAGPGEDGALSRRSRPVVKFAADGTALWNRVIAHNTTNESLALTMNTTPTVGMANADGAYFGINTYYEPTPGKLATGCTFIPADGTVGAARAAFVRLRMRGTSTSYSMAVNALTADRFAIAQTDTVSSAPSSIVFTTDADEASDASFGDYVRDTFTFAVAAGTASISTETWTRYTPYSTLTTSGLTATDSASTYFLTEPYGPTAPATTVTATSIAPTTALGSPFVLGLVTALPSWLAFGVPSNRRMQPAVGIAPTTALGTPASVSQFYAGTYTPTTAFGTGARNYNLAYAADAYEVTTAFGEPGSFKGLGPLPRVAEGIASALQFGQAAITANVVAAAVGSDSETVLGAPVALLALGASSFSATLFGAPMLRTPAQASGARLTEFGKPQVGQAGLCSSLLVGLRFGQAEALFGNEGAVTGIAATVFGAPTWRHVLRTRSGVMRTKFGSTQTERTAP
jgi:hypothetical protein